MLHFVDGWPLDFGDAGFGRRVTDSSSVAGHRPAVEDSSFRLPGRRGKVFVPGAVGEQVYSVTVAFMARQYEAARAMVSGLHRRLPPGRLVELRRVKGSVDVSAPATVLAATEVTSPSTENADLVVKVAFTIPGGVWLESVESSQAVPAGESVLSALDGGSADMEAVFTLVGDGASTMVEVEDVGSGAWWRLAGSVPAGKQVTVDPLAHTAVTHDGIDLSHMLEVGDRPFYLSSEPVVRHARNGVQQTTVRARRAWYE